MTFLSIDRNTIVELLYELPLSICCLVSSKESKVESTPSKVDITSTWTQAYGNKLTRANPFPNYKSLSDLLFFNLNQYIIM